MTFRNVVSGIHDFFMKLRTRPPRIRGDKVSAFIFNITRVITIASMVLPNLILFVDIAKAAGNGIKEQTPTVESVQETNENLDSIEDAYQPPLFTHPVPRIPNREKQEIRNEESESIPSFFPVLPESSAQFLSNCPDGQEGCIYSYDGDVSIADVPDAIYGEEVIDPERVLSPGGNCDGEPGDYTYIHGLGWPAPPSTVWVTYDLGGFYSITKIFPKYKAQKGAFAIGSFHLEFSLDGERWPEENSYLQYPYWCDVHPIDFETYGTDPKPVIARYIRFRISQSQGEFVEKLAWFAWKGESIPLDLSQIYSLNVCPLECAIAALKKNTQGVIGDPINTQTGGFEAVFDDLSIQTEAGELSFIRSYTSLTTDIYTDLLGYGWTHSLDSRLILPGTPGGEDGIVWLKAHSANQYRFLIISDEYFAYPGVFATLTKNVGPPITYTLVSSDQTTYLFDEDGKLKTLTNPKEKSFTYEYDTQDRLDIVYGPSRSRYLDIEYDPQGRIDTVSDQTGRHVSFTYDPVTGDLYTATNVMGEEWEYQYDTNHHLEKIINPDDDQTVRNVYDTEGRVTQQYDGLDDPVVDIIYNGDGTTTIKDALLYETTHAYSSLNVLSVSTDALNNNTLKEYTPDFRPEKITDPLENETFLSWDAGANDLAQVIDAQENTTDLEYDELNNLRLVIDPLGYETEYKYQDPNFDTLPTEIIYDRGGINISTQFVYYEPDNQEGQPPGEVELMIDPRGIETRYTYNEFGQVKTVVEAYNYPEESRQTEYFYDDHGWVVKIVNDDLITTETEYDNAGRVLRTVQNANDQKGQNEDNKWNITTTYTYDNRGNQIAVTDTYDVITRTYYDNNDRPVHVVQNLVGQTIDEDEPPSRDSSTPDENIRTDTTYDANGNVIASEDPLGVITRTYYDELNRPFSVVQNLQGQDIYVTTPPTYNPAFPDRNVRTDMDYDDNSNVIATTDVEGVITRTYYDKLNRPEHVVQNLSGQSISDPYPPARGSSTSTTNLRTDTFYDANGNVIATKDPLGVITRTYYDALNRPETVVVNLVGQSIYDIGPPIREGELGDENLRTDTYYDESGNVKAVEDPLGRFTEYEYNELGLMEKETVNVNVADPTQNYLDEYNIVTEYTYDDIGRLKTTIDTLGRVTENDYDELGRLIQVTQNKDAAHGQNYLDQFNIITTYTYDALGRQKIVTDTLGRLTENQYNDLGRLTKITQNKLAGQQQNYQDQYNDYYNIVTTYDYDEGGNQIAVTDTYNVITRTYFDNLNRPINVVRNLVDRDIYNPNPPPFGQYDQNLRTHTHYYGDGTIEYVMDELEIKTSFGYDDLNRQISVTDPLDHVTQYSYDVLGNMVSIKDSNNIVTHYEYDDVSRLKRVLENYLPAQQADHETNVKTEYVYDKLGNLKSIQDGRSFDEDRTDKTTFTYDTLNRLKTETDPMEHTWTYTYEFLPAEVSTRTALVDANGETTKYKYDALNRQILIDYPSPDADVTFAYDPVGRMTDMMTDGVGNTHWEYNNLNRATYITDPVNNTVEYTYTALGNLDTIKYPDTKIVDYDYDPVYRVDEVTDWSLNPPTTYVYDAGSRLKEVHLPNGVTSSYDYDDANRLTSLTHSDGVNTLGAYAYLYDDVGNREYATEDLVVPGGEQASIPGRGVVVASERTMPLQDNVLVYDSAQGFQDFNLVSVFQAEQPTSTATETPATIETPTATATPEPVATVTATPTPTATPEPVATVTPTPTVATKPTSTATPSPSNTLTQETTATETSTPKGTPLGTATPTVTSVPTQENTATGTATSTPTTTPTGTATSTPTPTPVTPGELLVTSTGDEEDSNPGDGVCDNGLGACTLRAAIQEANAVSGTDTISFEIPGDGPHTIAPNSQLPDITDPVIIDGTTQPGYAGTPVIVLDGSAAGEWVNGLTITGGESVMRGLAIMNFERAGIHLLSNGNVIEGNFIGPDASGVIASGNRMGVLVEKGENNTIGGETAEAANLISGNEIGVYLYGSGTVNNHVQGNRIGTDATGNDALGNDLGIRIHAAQGNMIGGDKAATSNLISGNEIGIFIQGSESFDNKVHGNQIGPNATGSKVLGNLDAGIWILDAPGNFIGGQDSGTGNRILGSLRGIHVQGSGAVDNLIQGNDIENLLKEDVEEPDPGRNDLPESAPFGDLTSNSSDSENEVSLSLNGEITQTKTTSQSTYTLVTYRMKIGSPIIGDYFSTSPVLLLSGATFTVDSTADGGDVNLSDGICADSGGNCTLRAAIEQANALAGADTINFNITGTGPHTIQPSSPLPVISEQIVVDATTQSGYNPTTPMIEVNGVSAGAGAYGLRITAGNSTVRGLVISEFDSNGIELDSNGSNVIEANFLGTNPAGSTADGNYRGLKVMGSSNSNTIGGTTSSARNLISGNDSDGIEVGYGPDGTIIKGNYIGTDVNGMLDLGNGAEGVDVTDADNTIIGGSEAGAGNVLSGNGYDGIDVDNANTPTGTVIQGNYIGTNVRGEAAIPNDYAGIWIAKSSDTTVGGPSEEARNIISGNDTEGIYVRGGANNTFIQGNYIGTDVTGELALPNMGEGIDIEDANNTTVGGTDPGMGNLISGNWSEGIEVRHNTPPTGTLIQGNYIGTDADGTAAIPNGFIGILVGKSTNTTIGGPSEEARNIISGNEDDGIRVQIGATGTVIQGNYIGTDVNGEFALPNTDDGIHVWDVTNTTIGGSDPGVGNLVSGNSDQGIVLRIDVSDTVIQGNFVGTDASGESALPNGNIGIFINDATSTTVGGAIADARNLVSGNGDDGMRLYLAVGTVIQGNYIGTDATGTTALPNATHGIVVGPSSNTTIGGSAAGEGNTIAFNTWDGIFLNNASAIGVDISGNSIFENTDLGIDLYPNNVTPNDLGDLDTGANNLQNFPIISTASSDGSTTTTIGGTLNSTASTTFHLEFFASPSCDPSGYGEGQVYLGTSDETTDINGDVTFQVVLPVGVPDGYFITATATDPDGNTSEFSACLSVTVVGGAPVDNNWYYDYDPLYRLTYACSNWDEPTTTCNGDEFEYTYDAVGNRTSQTINDLTITYTYDNANRLIDAGGQTYEWDYNGNLTCKEENNQVWEHEYDAANRLTKMKKMDGTDCDSPGNPTDTYEFAYNGLGDRLWQKVDTVITEYALDLNTGLTQVLSDGTTTYLYGNGRIAEYTGTDWTYYLTDALGSVRQIANSTARVTLTNTYEPYGTLWSSSGTALSNYGFAGEWMDETGLQHLRARYLDTGIGRFISRDTWGGNLNNPLSLNRWMYVEGNPINFVDPSGLWYCTGHADCENWISQALDRIKGVYPEGWNIISKFNIRDEQWKKFQRYILFSADPLHLIEDCDSIGFHFQITQNRPGGFTMQTFPWVIKIWGDLIESSPSAQLAALLGHEFFHLLVQSPQEVITIYGELRAAQFEALLDKKQGVGLPFWLNFQKDGNWYDVTDLRLHYREDLEIWQKAGGYPWWEPFAPAWIKLIDQDEHPSTSPIPSPIPTPPETTPTPPTQTTPHPT